MAKTLIGTSGWNYKGWKEHFYKGVPQRAWLQHCAAHFSAVEINGTFYRLQAPESFARWAEQTPDDFRFAMKGSRFITHNKKLVDIDRSIRLLRDSAEPMGQKLAAVVWQLPANFRRNDERLARFLEGLRQWSNVHHAIEFRHASWFDSAIREKLDTAGVGVCQSDAADWPCWEAVAGPLAYIRLHGHTRTYASAYSDGLLDRWAEKAQQWHAEGRDVHVYFDNDSEGAAPYDAMKLIERLGEPVGG